MGIFTSSGLNQLSSTIEEVSNEILGRIALIDEIVIISEQVQSDVYQLSVLKSIGASDDAIQSLYSRLERRLTDLHVAYGKISEKWELDEIEMDLLQRIQAPLGEFRAQTLQASEIVLRDPALGVVMVRSSSKSFESLQSILAEFRRYEEAQIALAEGNALADAQRINTTDMFAALGLTLIVILATIYISDLQITRPIQAMTKAMSRLAADDSDIEIEDTYRQDEIGEMARALEVFRQTYLVKEKTELELKAAYEHGVKRQAAVLNLTEDLQLEISERKLAEKTIQRQNDFLIALQTTTLELLSELDLNYLLENIVRRAAQLLDTQAGFLDLIDPDTGKLLPRVGIGALAESLTHNVEPGEGVAGTVWISGNPLIIDDYNQWESRVNKFSISTIRSIIGVPLFLRGEVIGVLGLAHDVNSSNAFGQQSVEYLTQFAQLASISIENARLYSAAKTELLERQLAEEAREVLVAELEAKNRELESFVYTVSHDLRSPLVSISGFSGVLLKQFAGSLDERGTHLLNRLQANVTHMEDLITNLLKLSRIGRVVGRTVPVHLEPFLEGLIATRAGDLENSQAEVVISSPLPTVEVDRTRMGQVFSNLLDNAIKFRKPDQALRIEICCQENKLDYVFSIRDNGIGIDPRFAEKIFLPFQKLDPESDGMGIGLALVRRIIKVHGGQSWIESQPGKGVTFKFSLPRLRDMNSEGVHYGDAAYEE